ncbi:hypothetical protein PF008_g20027 [Phytophthora fragariae]|uniref:FYVE-type domain-containing protein n=1 Tax=Phytophthora fragariae TaxID=53985 RepID=A0A6G0R1Y2_9STRA|nr:hypothetical protein PF008_g20027 [Phytophthora fragariae]
MKGVTPFAAVHVTPDQARRYERQARQLLDDTIREFDTHVAACGSGKNPLHNKWQWKPLKTQEGLNVYKERQPTHPELNPLAGRSTKTSSIGSASGCSTTSATDRVARPTKALAMAAYTPEMATATSSAAVPGSSSVASAVITGRLDGSLTDVMYGLLATDSPELQLRLRYMADSELLDTAMMSHVQPPTAANPFQFIGLQWLLRGETIRAKSSSRGPRDFVVLVASGVVQHKVPGTLEPQEIGYYLCQSAELPECGELSKQGFTRGWLSTCSLFIPAQGGAAQVDVFSRGFVDFKGKMQDYQATNMITTLLLAGVTEAATCGQSKKLGWLLNFKGAAAEFRRAQPESKASSGRCGICDRRFGILHSVASCSLCRVKICSRCRVSRDVSFVKRRDVVASTTQSRSWDEGHHSTGQVRCLNVILCKNCKMNAGHLDARVVARREIEAGYGLNEIARGAPVSIVEAPVRPTRNSFSSEHSYSSDGSTSQMRFWTPGTDTAKLRGCEAEQTSAVVGSESATLRGNCDDEPSDDVFKPKILIARMDSGKPNFSDCSAAKTVSADCSFASTLPSPRDLKSAQEESSLELTTYIPRQQHQPLYAEDPEIIYTQRPANPTNSRADLVRRMQELQMSAESVYQFTSQMNANARDRLQPLGCSYTSTFISELD